ncbi:MAG: hypothetical protein ACRDOK_21060 [Streptosporangiaceae bacterium]
MFATLTDFDGHQPGRCLDPAAMGLERAGAAWGTPAGNAHRAGLAGRLFRGKIPADQPAARMTGTRPRPRDEEDRLREIRELMRRGYVRPLDEPPSLAQMGRARARLEQGHAGHATGRRSTDER